MMESMEKLLEQERKLQEKLSKIKKEKEDFEKKIIAKIPAVLKEKYPQIYEEIRETIIGKPTPKKPLVAMDKEIVK